MGERLKDRIFTTVFPHLARGFLEDRKRRLGINKAPTEEELRDTFEATLTLLYRLLFLLYAEARDLLPIREAPYREASLKRIKEEIAQAAGGAESDMPERLKKSYTTKETTLYDRIGRLCRAMDVGDPTLNVPIYNGGLFITNPSESDAREQRIARYLTEHKVPDQYLALAIDRLARDPDEKTFALVSIDYKSLEVRHLGSIYEGLLEFKLKIAEEDLTTKTEKKKEKYIPLSEAKPKKGKSAEVIVRKGKVYLSNNKAERKASGSYYTPDPIVEYIVEHTVGPVLDEKLEALRGEFRKVRKTFDREVEKATAYPVKKSSGDTWEPREFAAEKTYTAHHDLVEQLFDFRTLDPAMGSGHFLVEAVDFITDRLLSFLNQFPVNPVTFMLVRTRRNILEALGEQGVSVDPDKLTEVNLLKRHVLKRCIYGVDLNPMAVELAKVSLWLDAFTLGAPLSFLDHHLRCGNSLVGATFAELDELLNPKRKGGRAMFGIDYEPLLRAIQHVLFVNKMADATADEVKQSASEYTQAREELSGYQIVMDLLVAKHFGFPKAPDLLEYAQELDLSNYERFLNSLDDDTERKLVNKVEALARQPDHRFFHWEIEFPEVFFGFSDTEQRHLKHKNKREDGSAGFDAVVGNPPYVRVQRINELASRYYFTEYDTLVSKTDLSQVFLEKGLRLTHRTGRIAYIMSSQWMATDYGRKMRAFLAAGFLHEVVDFGSLPVFPAANTYPAILVLSRGFSRKVAVRVVNNLEEAFHDRGLDSIPPRPVQVSSLSERPWNLRSYDLLAVLRAQERVCCPLESYAKANIGTLTGMDEAFVVTGDHADEDRLEDTLLLPYAYRGEEISRFGITSPASLVIYPYVEGENGHPDLIREGTLEDTFPRIHAHLMRFKDRLRERKDSRKHYAKGEDWYRHLRAGSYNYINPPKIIVKGIDRYPVVGELPGGTVFNGANCPGIIVHETCPISPLFLLGVLNSLVATHYFRSVCPPKLSGYVRYNATNINRLPVPVLDLDSGEDKRIHDEVVELVSAIRQTAISKNAGDEESISIMRQMNELDDLLFDLYRLPNDAVRAIREEANLT